MSGQVTVEALGLRFRYGRSYAVDGVSLELREGEVLCVIGPNGAGKTTLLGGMDRWCDNPEIRKRSDSLLARRPGMKFNRGLF